METVIQIILLLCCLILSAFFACSETALFSLSKSKLNVMAEQDEKGKKIFRHLKHAPKLLITLLIGNMFVNIFSTSLSETIASHFIEQGALEISIISMTILIIIFAEITPKVIAVNNSQRVSMFVIPLIDFLYKILTPIREILYRLSSIILSLLSKFFRTDLHSSYEELQTIIQESQNVGILFEHEKDMIDGILRLNKLRINTIMTPRTEVFALDINDPVHVFYNSIYQSKYSRIPIYEDHMDNLIGILYVKDFLMIRKEKTNIRDLLRKPYFIPETKIAMELFREMRDTHNHMAIVVDEYGGIDGVVTLEDILEEIFGEILYKKDTLLSLKQISPKSMKISGLLTIEDFNEVFKTNIIDENNVTISGYLSSQFGHIPKKGESIAIDDLEFLITRSKKNRIVEILVTKQDIFE